MITTNELIAFVLGVLLGAGLFLVYYRFRRKDTQDAADKLLSDAKLHFESLSADVLRKNTEQFFTIANEKLSDQVKSGEQDLENKKQLIDQTLTAMKKELDGVQDLVINLEKDRETKFGEITEKLKQAVEQTGRLQETTEKLRIALTSTQARGQWGERMAEDVLRAAGFIEGVNYQKQQTLKDAGTRPDYTFLLPRGLKVHMDVKFPLDNYLKYLDAETEELRCTCRDRYLQDVRNRIKEITKRDYINPEEGTINYVIVFIPNEQLFAFVSHQDPKLLDDALRLNVILCSPLTLFGILAIVRQAIDNFYLEERTLQVLEALSSFQKQWTAFVDSFDHLGKKINAVQSEYTTLTTTRRNRLDRQWAKIENLRQKQDAVLQLEETDSDEKIDRHAEGVVYNISGTDRE